MAGKRSADYGKVTEKRLSVFMDNITYEPNTGCWLWVGTLNNAGYGSFYLSGFSGAAHRYSYLAFKGQIHKGMFICHHCDTRSCVNPDHLYAGTPLDNMLDLSRRQRRHGEKNCRSKLKSISIPVIKYLHSLGISNFNISKKFSVSPRAIRSVINGETWTHIKEEILKEELITV